MMIFCELKSSTLEGAVKSVLDLTAADVSRRPTLRRPIEWTIERCPRVRAIKLTRFKNNASKKFNVDAITATPYRSLSLHP